jgi:hypothetical protein
MKTVLKCFRRYWNPTEFKGDYEIGSDGKHFRIEQDYYTPTQSGYAIQKKWTKTLIQNTAINEFNYK